MEAPAWHPPNPGRERDERADHRQHARYQDGDLSIFMEEAVSRLQVPLVEPDVAAVLLDQRSSTVRPDFVRQQRPQIASDCPRRRRPINVEDALINQVS